LVTAGLVPIVAAGSLLAIIAVVMLTWPLWRTTQRMNGLQYRPDSNWERRARLASAFAADIDLDQSNRNNTTKDA
jgi:hypothetical protein